MARAAEEVVQSSSHHAVSFRAMPPSPWESYASIILSLASLGIPHSGIVCRHPGVFPSGISPPLPSHACLLLTSRTVARNVENPAVAFYISCPCLRSLLPALCRSSPPLRCFRTSSSNGCSAIIVLTDAFGYDTADSRALGGILAAQGYTTLIPDIYR